MGETPVLVTVPADAPNARILRVVAGAVAARTGLGVDRIDDLSLAIDEACGELLDLAGGSSWECAITADGDGIAVRIRTVGGDATAWPRPDWRESLQGIVLMAIADDVEPLLDAGEPAVRFTMRP
jgi:anti-sigma regulatory factor (Ser/Thr protein kinase)